MRSPRSSTGSCRTPRRRRPEMELFLDDVFNLADIVLRVAREDPQRIAVIDLDGWESLGTRRYKRHTYAELSADVESVAVGLREMGIAERTRIVCMSPPSYETCVMGVALTRVGAFSIWIDPAVGYRNVAERLGRVQPEAFLGNALAHLGRVTFGWGPRDLRKLVLTESPLLPGGRIITGFPPFPGAHSIRSLRKHAPAEPQPPNVGPDDPCAVLYTTGSTGPAKPSLYLHRNFCQLFRNAHHSWGWDKDNEVPVDMAVFPAFLFIPISAGGTMVVPPIDFARQGSGPGGLGRPDPSHQRLQGRVVFRRADPDREPGPGSARAQPDDAVSEASDRGRGADHGSGRTNAARGGSGRRVGGELRCHRGHAVDRVGQSRAPGRLVGPDRAGGRHLCGLRPAGCRVEDHRHRGRRHRLHRAHGWNCPRGRSAKSWCGASTSAPSTSSTPMPRGRTKCPTPKGIGTASAMSATSTRRAGSGSAVGCHSG